VSDVQHQLTRLEINVTSKCNANCVYCANDLKLTEQSKNDTLPLEKIIELIDRVKPEIINFTGGEPTLQWELLLQYIKEVSCRGIVVQLDTHALNLSREQIDTLIAAGVTRFHISYSTLSSNFTELRGVPYVRFETLENNIRYISDLEGVDCLCECILHNDNHQDIQAIYERCSSLGADEFQVQPLMPAGKADLSMMLPPQKLAKILKNLFRLQKAKTPIKVWCSYVTRCSKYSDMIYVPRQQGATGVIKGITGLESGCQEGWSRLHVHNNGDVIVCDITNAGPPIGNIYDSDILEIYHNNPFLKQLRKEYPQECAQCEDWDNCHDVCPVFMTNLNDETRRRFKDWLNENLKT